MWRRQLSATQGGGSTHGLGEGLVRVSVGLEDEVDLLKDFAQALDGIKSS
jgi:cystathionine beta-lyase/cystathionine gamma-synthase